MFISVSNYFFGKFANRDVYNFHAKNFLTTLKENKNKIKYKKNVMAMIMRILLLDKAIEAYVNKYNEKVML